MSEERDLYIVLTRLEGKIDTSLAIHGGDIEALKTQNVDHESRIRETERKVSAVENKPTISPKQLWAGMATAAGAAAAIVTVAKSVLPA